MFGRLARELRQALSAPGKDALGFEPDAVALFDARAQAEAVRSLAAEVLDGD